MKHKRLTATMVLFEVAVAPSVCGDPTTLTVSKAGVTVTGSSSTTLDFPISRGGSGRSSSRYWASLGSRLNAAAGEWESSAI